MQMIKGGRHCLVCPLVERGGGEANGQKLQVSEKLHLLRLLLLLLLLLWWVVVEKRSLSTFPVCIQMMPTDLGRSVGGTPQVGWGIGFLLLNLHFHLLIWISLSAAPPIEASPAQTPHFTWLINQSTTIYIHMMVENGSRGLVPDHLPQALSL